MGADEVPADYREAVAQVLYHAQTIEWLLRAYLSDLNEAADRLLRHRWVRFKTRSDHMRKSRSLGMHRSSRPSGMRSSATRP